MKTLIKQFIPPVIVKARHRLIEKAAVNANSNEKFCVWWNQFKLTSHLDEDLVIMMDSFIDSEGFKGMSKYWNYLNKKNLTQLSEQGLENFKQTVATNYYTWVNGINQGFGQNFLRDLEKYELAVPVNQIAKKHDLLDISESILFNTMTVLLYNYVSSTFPGIIENCEEEALGNSPYININGKKVSQDVLNSSIEYMAIQEGTDEGASKFLEIGAGSGRTAEFFLKKHSSIQYVICDIVPALYISQYYLSNVFPDRSVFRFRDFEDFSDIKDEFEKSQIAFIMPHQLEKLPKKIF